MVATTLDAKAIERDADEMARVETREFLSDVTQPITYLTALLGNIEKGLLRGSLAPIFQNAFRHGATMMLNEVKEQCPVHSGHLRDSLYVTTEDLSEIKPGQYKIDRHAPGHVGSLSVKNSFAYVTTDVHYAYFVEFGTRFRAATPFMRPAFDSTWTSVATSIGDAVVSDIMFLFVGRLAIEAGDVALQHQAKTEQEHGFGRDLGVRLGMSLLGKGIAKGAGKIAGKLAGKAAGKAAGKTAGVSAAASASRSSRVGAVVGRNVGRKIAGKSGGQLGKGLGRAVGKHGGEAAKQLGKKKFIIGGSAALGGLSETHRVKKQEKKNKRNAARPNKRKKK